MRESLRCTLPPIPIAEVMQSPECLDHSSPDGPLVAAAGASTLWGSDSAISSDDDVSIPCTLCVAGAKTMGLDDRYLDDDSVDPQVSLLFSLTVDDPLTPTDNKVRQYAFFDRLKDYLEGNKINEVNCASVELCIFVEAGAAVCGMDLMKKEK